MISNKVDNADKAKYQQQILFAENDLLNSKSITVDENLPTNDQQIIFENQDYLPAQTVKINVIADEEKYTPVESKPSWAWRIIFSLSALMFIVQASDFFITGFAQSPISTSIYAIIASALVFVSSSALFKEFSSLRQLKRQQKIKMQTLAMLNEESAPETLSQEQLLQIQSSEKEGLKTAFNVNAKTLCEKISKNLPGDLLSDIEEKKWQEILDSHYSDAELMQLYNKLVLSKVDQKALDEVAKFSTEAVVLVALSPVAIIDMLIILWRNLRMLNKISGLYGLKLGYWSRIKLIKQVFINMAYAGASELIADFGTEMLGADMLDKLSTRLAQGLGAGLLTARLGLRTIQACRPLPFDENAPSLGHVRQEILSQIKQLIKK